jgi:dihydroflavonol-4-reductase
VAQRALITGGTGFVGSNLALRLVERRWQVAILARPQSSLELLEGGPFEVRHGDVLSPDSLAPAMHDIDVVFHAAGVVDHWNQGVDRMVEVNVEGTRHVVEAALQVGVPRFVHISSSAAMGIHPNEVVDESYQFNVPASRFVYGHSKFLAEEIVLDAVKNGLPAVIVNPTTVIGPRDVRKVSSGMVVEIVKHCAPPLIPPGGLNIVPICDVAQGIIEAALKGHVGERVILGGANMTYLQLYQTIANVVGCGMKLKAMPKWQVSFIAGLTDMLQPQTSSPVPLTGNRLRLESQLFYFDSSKARNLFQMPNTPLRVTIGRTYEWYEMMGEFDEVYENLDQNGLCKYCKRARYCVWPPQQAAPASAVTHPTDYQPAAQLRRGKRQVIQ